MKSTSWILATGTAAVLALAAVPAPASAGTAPSGTARPDSARSDSAPSGAAPSGAADTWTGTWSAAPQGGSDRFDDQTVRQIVHTSIAGSSARIRLSNAFGGTPLTVRDIHIAERAAGSSISPGSDRAVTFGGGDAVTIPAGGSAVSDTVDFAVGARSDVAVSFHLPGPTGPATAHQTALQTNYVAPGDVSGATDLTNATARGSYVFLSGLDVRNPAAEGAVVALGASITDGVASRSDANKRWPNALADRLTDSGRTVGVLNQGISGNQLLSDGAGQSALNRFDRDVLDQPGVRWVIFSDDPINDLTTTNPSADQLIDGLGRLIARAHERGVKFLCSTLTPFEGYPAWNSGLETKRAAVNAFVRGADSGCDAVVDQDTATHDPARLTWYRPDLDNGDHLHPNEAGLRAIADAVDPGDLS